MAVPEVTNEEEDRCGNAVLRGVGRSHDAEIVAKESIEQYKLIWGNQADAISSLSSDDDYGQNFRLRDQIFAMCYPSRTGQILAQCFQVRACLDITKVPRVRKHTAADKKNELHVIIFTPP